MLDKRKIDADLRDIDNSLALLGVASDSDISRLMGSEKLDKMIEEIQREREAAKIRKRSFKDEVESHDNKTKTLARGKRGGQKKINFMGYDYENTPEIRKVWQENGENPYTVIHRNFSKSKDPAYQRALPTKSQLRDFLSDIERKTIVVAEMSPDKTLKGYLVLRKTGKTPKLGTNYAAFNDEPNSKVIKGTQHYRPTKIKDYSKSLDEVADIESLQKVCSDYNLKYRFVPVNKGVANPASSPGALERTLESSVAIIFFIASIIFSSGILTGSAVNLIAKPTANYASIVFFLIALVLSFLAIKKRK